MSVSFSFEKCLCVSQLRNDIFTRPGYPENWRIYFSGPIPGSPPPPGREGR